MAALAPKEMQRSTPKEREVMERQFGKRHGRGAAKKSSRSRQSPGPL
jgi:hypothetical protein